jgi:hypothetical protein
MGMSLLKNGIDIRKAGRKTVIELLRGEEVYDKFKVVEFSEKSVDNNSRTIKVLKLKRI